MTAFPTVAYVGLTHLGLCSAAAAAAKGCQVIAFDPDESVVRRIAAGQLPVVEPELDALVAQHADRLAWTSRAEDLAQASVVYVAPDVPTDDYGRSDLSSVNALLQQAAKAVPEQAVLVVLSQVPPGFSRSLDLQRSVFYQVETLIFGRAIERAIHPERIIVGCEAPETPLPPAFCQFLELFDCPILPMRFESAELTKIAINCFLVASVSTSNTLAELCEYIGARWAEIAPALRMDKRIGAHAYLTAGLGIAGGNLERDLATVIRIGHQAGSDVGTVEAWVSNSRHRREWVYDRLTRHLSNLLGRPRVGILGLAYKENTHSIKNSPSISLIRRLGHCHVRAYDPAVLSTAVEGLGIELVPSPLDACRDADVVAIMTPWPAFRMLDPSDLAAVLAGRTVIDPFGLLPRAACRNASLKHYVLGEPETA